MMTFLKEKYDGIIKAHRCADGRKQREKYDNSNATSPKVSTEAVLIYAVIYAYKERDLVMADIPGAYLSVDMEKKYS